MKVKEMIDIIVDKGNSDEIYKLHEIMDELICNLKNENPKMYHEYKTYLYEMAYGKIILLDKAEEIVHDMLPYGEHFDIDTCKQIIRENNFRFETSDFYLVINSIYNDYCNVFGEEATETYIKMTKSWLNDNDAVENKVYTYFMNIPKKD